MTDTVPPVEPRGEVASQTGSPPQNLSKHPSAGPPGSPPAHRKARRSGLNRLAGLRTLLLSIRRLWLVRVWGMDIHPTAQLSLSAKFDKTFPRGVHVGAHTLVAFEARILCHDRTRGRARAQHEAMLLALAEAAPGARVVLMTMNPAGGLRGAMRSQLSRHYAALGPLADRHGAGLVDLTPRWRADRPALAARPEGLHPEEAVARGVIVPPLAAAIAAALPGAPSCGAERG